MPRNADNGHTPFSGRMTLIRSSIVMAWLVTLAVTAAPAQTQQSRLMGTVTDESGAALPGVTVTVVSAATRPASVVTDGSGRYATAWMPPGTYNVTFVLSGFETRNVTAIPLAAGQTGVLDQQLALASLAETVEVVAPAPAPPPPPAPPKPKVKPIDKQAIASACGPRQPPDYSIAIGKIVSHRDQPDRQLLGPGDVLRIDAGEKQGVANGQNFVVRRRFRTGDRSVPKKMAAFGEQTAGVIQIIETQPDASVALVVYSCGELYAGDWVEPFNPLPAYFAITDGTPRFDDPARITIGEHDASVAGPGGMMVIDRGILQQVQRGQRVTIFRRKSGGPPLVVGDGVIIAVRPDSATMRIERATDAVAVGDLVALHR